ncbi:hypothetical protein BG006_005821 [Podila minutissima]|uniref:CENP-T/Histone H4 histone fold domain-containing protein n=1 Tax=Podila minutissima TaxID=64525 RepID=A0A9P5VLI2_9FUNG|nr:hypothetical protein BG006_005821 [Podila minutissima]
MIADAFKFEHTGRERHSPMTILRKLTRIQGFNPPPQPSPERPPIPGSSQWKKLTPKSARTRRISIPGEEGDNNPFLATSAAMATRTPTSNGSGRTPLGRQPAMSNVAAATAQQLAFVRYREENPFLDPEDFYQRWEDEESEVARLNQQSFRTSFGFGTGMAQDESLLEMDGDTGSFSVGHADMSNPLVDPADLGNRSRHIDDITLMSDSAFKNEGKELGARQNRGPEFDRDFAHGKDQQGQPPVDELEEMDQDMDLELDAESLETITTPSSTGAVQQDELEIEMEEQEEEVESEQPEVTMEEEDEEVEEQRMEQERHDSSEQEATEEEEQDPMKQKTQDASDKEEEERAEDDQEEDEPSQEQPDLSAEAEQEAFDQDMEAEAFAAQMEEDEAAELAEMEAAKMAQMEEDEAEAAKAAQMEEDEAEAANATQMEEDEADAAESEADAAESEADAAESEAAKVAQLKELLDLEGHDILGENDLVISLERQETPIALQESVDVDEGRDKNTDIDQEHPTDVDAAVHTAVDDRTNLEELKSPDAREQSPTMEEQEPQEYEDGYMNVHEEDHIEQQEHEEQHDGPGTQYFDDFPSELGMMSNGEFLPVSQPTTKKSARTTAAGITVPTLPTSLQKQLVHTFSRSRISQEAMQVILEGSNLFFEQAANDLAAYADHAGRKTIDESDVECLMQRLRITNDKVNVESLLQRYLPRELRDLVLYPSDMRQVRRR